MNLINILSEIKKKQSSLNLIVTTYGILDDKVLSLSQEIDNLIIDYYRTEKLKQVIKKYA